jgi:hypothetical protein
MSYYYEDPEFANYGNHGNEYDEYESYSDYAEPDHCEYEDQYHDDTNHEHAPQEFEQGYGEAEPEYIPNEEEHGPEEFEYEENKVHEHGELAYEPGYDRETHYTAYEPHGFNYDNERTSPVAFDNTPTSFEDAHGFTPTADDPIAYAYPSPPSPPFTHGDHTPTYVSPPPSFSPPHTPRAHDAPYSNQQGHVTASKHAYVSDDGRDDDKPRGFERDETYEHGPVYINTMTADGAFPRPQLIYHEESGEYVHPDFLTPAQIAHHHHNPNPPPLSPTQDTPAPSPRNYADINVLLQDIQDGDSKAIAYMAELNRYTAECGRIEMEKQMNGDDEYGEQDSGRESQQTDEVKDPKNNATPTEPPLANTPISPPPPSPNTLGNNTPTHTTPYITSRLRPQPWPNKKHNKHHFGAHTLASTTTRRQPQPWPNKKRNKHHHGTRTPAGTTTKRRPPPWPILPTTTTLIFSIENSRPPPWPNIRHHRRKKHSPVSTTPPTRPPPWPIISHHIHPTPQNRRNAKRRIKAQSRSILDEVSF